MTILHIAHLANWQAAQTRGHYTVESLTTEGFIHCSHPSQVLGVAERYYTPWPGPLLLLTIDPARLTAPLRNELATNNEAFPHIYGPLNLDAVLRADAFAPNAIGRYTLPPHLTP